MALVPMQDARGSRACSRRDLTEAPNRLTRSRASAGADHGAKPRGASPIGIRLAEHPPAANDKGLSTWSAARSARSASG